MTDVRMPITDETLEMIRAGIIASMPGHGAILDTFNGTIWNCFPDGDRILDAIYNATFDAVIAHLADRPLRAGRDHGR